ncbi:hypothetical protein N7U32_20030, partial [Mycobacterium tuberculosis]|nr:hypothetical protein [Mycobacterium tuberculosis]
MPPLPPWPPRPPCPPVPPAPVNSEERHVLFDEMLIELDIHFRIEDDLYYP